MYRIILLTYLLIAPFIAQSQKLKYSIDEKVMFGEEDKYRMFRIIPPYFSENETKVVLNNRIVYIKDGKKTYIDPKFYDRRGREIMYRNFYFMDVFFSSADEGFAINDDGMVFKTTDGGKVFRFGVDANYVKIDYIYDAEFISKDTVIVVGSILSNGWKPAILITTDYFDTYTLHPIPEKMIRKGLQYLHMIEFDKEKKNGYIYAASFDGKHVVAVFRTTDRGMTWVPVEDD